MSKRKGQVAGQPVQQCPLDGYSVRLTAWHARQARKLGNGELGEGVRRAIERCVDAEKLKGG